MDFNILLVDNDPIYCESCSELLKSAGFHVYVAGSLAQAHESMDTLWLHLALVDVRLTNDDDRKDKTGLDLACEIAPVIPTLILTRFPDIEDIRKAMKSRMAGKRAVVDYIDKKKPTSDLIQAIRELIGQHIDLNIDLKIDWKACDRYSLVSFIEPQLRSDLIPNRSAELEDLFRMLYKQKSIRLHRDLWHDSGRVALVVFAFDSHAVPESSIIVCGPRKIIEDEARRFKKSSPRILTETATTLVEMADTLHYAVVQYMLNSNDLEAVRNLATLYQTGPEKSLHIAIETLFGETLRAWHRDKRIYGSASAPGSLHRGLVDALDGADLELRAKVIEEQVSTLGVKLKRSAGEMSVKLGNRSFTYADPLTAIHKLATRFPLELAANTPGNISGETVLADGNGHIWLTDFADAGLAPLGWNAANLEAAVRFDWLDVPDLTKRFEMELVLVHSDPTNPDTQDLDPACRKSVHTISKIRKLLSEDPCKDLATYQYIVFLQGARRLVAFDPTSPLTGLEIARIGQVWLAMGMLASSIEESDLSEVLPVSNEITIKDKQARTLLVGGREVSLAPKPFSLFLYLFENPERICTRKELVEKVFDGKYDDQYLHSLVGRIRKAIGDDAKNPLHLTTISNTGYRLRPKP